jgi:acetyl esterase
VTAAPVQAREYRPIDLTPDGFWSQSFALRYAHPGMAVPGEAVPARIDELAGVPSALITCSELDPLRDSLLPEWDMSQQPFELQGAALRRALHQRRHGRAEGRTRWISHA